MTTINKTKIWRQIITEIKRGNGVASLHFKIWNNSVSAYMINISVYSSKKMYTLSWAGITATLFRSRKICLSPLMEFLELLY